MRCFREMTRSSAMVRDDTWTGAFEIVDWMMDCAQAPVQASVIAATLLLEQNGIGSSVLG